MAYRRPVPIFNCEMNMNTSNEYNEDFYEWTGSQVIALRNHDVDKIDFIHLIEEIECLGISLQRALESYLSNLMMHKLKIMYQPQKHTMSWDNSIKNAYFQIEKLIRKNPSLKSHLTDLFQDAYFTARLNASSETGLSENVFPTSSPWSIEELLDFMTENQVKRRA